MSESQLKTKILQQGNDPHDFSFRLPCLIGDTVYWIQRYHSENKEAQGDCPVCGGTGSLFGVNGSKWDCPSNLCHDGVIVLWRMDFVVEAGDVTSFEVALEDDGEEHCMVWIEPDGPERNRHMNVEDLFFSEGEALREARRQAEKAREQQLGEVDGEIPDDALPRLTEGEYRAVAILAAHLAKMHREDIIGAILKTGAFKVLEDQDGAVARLAGKLDAHLPEDHPYQRPKPKYRLRCPEGCTWSVPELPEFPVKCPRCYAEIAQENLGIKELGK